MSPRGTSMSYEDYRRLPDDGRTEYLRGEAVVVPPPSAWHQIAGKRLARILDDAAPEGFEAVPAWGWQLPTPGYEPIPDLMLVPPIEEPTRFIGTPALAVEILSTNRRTDLVEKAGVYAEAGLPYYWIVDLAEPSVTAFELRDGRFVEVAVATAGRPAELPFAGGSAVVDVDALG